MFLVNAALNDISIGTAGLVALLGYAVVFVGLIALMAVILIDCRQDLAVAQDQKSEAPARLRLPLLPLLLRLPLPRPFRLLRLTGVRRRGASSLTSRRPRRRHADGDRRQQARTSPSTTLRFKSMKEVM